MLFLALNPPTGTFDAGGVFELANRRVEDLNDRVFA
jgi:hypothetical protein